MSNSRNRFDKKDSLELGEKAEELFADLARKAGWQVSPSSRDQNIDEHWDFQIAKGGETFKVEVKSAKRVDRSDSGIQFDYTWVEIHGVRPKDTGWLFGKADLIAFEREAAFVFVKRLDLLKVVNKKVNLVAKVTNPRDALYKIYRRDGRKDKLTLLPSVDLEEIKFMEWKKNL
jgi:hypothetical protein